MTFLLLILTMSIPVVVSIFSGRGLIHYFQLVSYQFPGYFRTLRRNPLRAFMPGVCTMLVSAVLFYINKFLFNKLNSLNLVLGIFLGILLLIITVAVCIIFGSIIERTFSEKKSKKPLVFTARLKRLYVVDTITLCLISYFIVLSNSTIFIIAWPILLPFTLGLGGLLAWPIEKLISEFYFRDARKKLLSNPNLIKIGITGSFGKTSVKYILGALLSEKYPTLITPTSINTPMGVTRIIRDRLRPSHKIFVAEMGARHVGDIKEMCRLVNPNIGILTSVAPQHLDTFHTIERIQKTKYELIQALPKTSGHAYFANDNGIVQKLYQQTSGEKSIVGFNDNNDCWAANISVSSKGSTFELHTKSKGSIICQTKLLGEHSIQNIVLASCVALDLGLTLKQVAKGIQQLTPVQHRLELISNENSFTIIDDAYNSNPVGAKAALKVLSSFEKRRIIITPGMVELGKNEKEFNKEFGKAMKDCVDIAIIIGKKRVLPIIEGMKEVGFSDDAIFQVDSLAESTTLLHQFVLPTDTVLYENDLPDHYQEV